MCQVHSASSVRGLVPTESGTTRARGRGLARARVYLRFFQRPLRFPAPRLAPIGGTEPCPACPSGRRFAGGAAQAQFVAFLACFEGRHHANMSAVDACASATPLVRAALATAGATRSCFEQQSERDRLWALENARPGRATLVHFPTVKLDGRMWQNGSVPNISLASAICGDV